MTTRTAVGIHIFAGLFTRGVVDAGFDVKATLEDGEFGVATHRKNFNLPVYTDPSTWPVADLTGVDMIYSNSPCAGFSLANSKKGSDNPVNNYLQASSDAALKMKPGAYVVESVTNLFKDGDQMVSQWESQWGQAGYYTTRLVEDALYLGLPQRRKRALFVAIKTPFNPNCHGVDGFKSTVRDAIADLSTVEAKVGSSKDCLTTLTATHPVDGRAITWHVAPIPSLAMRLLIPYSKPGQRLQEMSDEIMSQTYWKYKSGKNPTGRPGLLNRRLDYDKPSYTLTGGCHWIHPEQDRYITVREKARLMGVPDDFNFASKNVHTAYAEVGKAVSPVVGRWVAGQVLDSLAGKHKSHVTNVDLTAIDALS